MNHSMMTQYLKRIGLTAIPLQTEAGLKQLHAQQHRSIPFENLDVINGQPILLSEQALFDKLVSRRRGGYCHELNGLLFGALKALNFNARTLLARTHLNTEPTGRSHRVTLVNMQGQQWLVDAGFGSLTPRAPLPIRLNEKLHSDIQTFQFVKNDLYGLMLQIEECGTWSDMYSLDMSHVCEGDLIYSNHCTSTHPSSIFTCNCIVAIPIENGTITLLNDRLKIKEGDRTTEITLTNEMQYFEALKKHFDLVPNIPYQTLTQYC